MILAILAVATALDAAGDVARLGWMAGSWAQEQGGVVTSEVWLPPLDGAMGGAARTTRPGEAPRLEFMKITAEPAGATFTAMPEGQAPVPFLLKPSPDGEAIFENLDHDFPQRVIYRRCGQDLCARIEGMVGGELKGVDWRYRRIDH